MFWNLILQGFIKACGLFSYLKIKVWGLPCGPVVKTSSSGVEGVGSIPGWGTKILQAKKPRQ